MLMPTGPCVERAAAQGDATEPPLNWTKTAEPPRPAAAADGVTGADSLGTTQTHGGDRDSGMQRLNFTVKERLNRRRRCKTNQ